MDEEYEEYEEDEEEEGKSGVNKILVGAIVVLLAAVSVVTYQLVKGMNQQTHMGLALTQEQMDIAVAEAQQNAAYGNISLSYENNAYSQDGQTFSCYLMNSEGNLYDAFFMIYADAELTDVLFSSGLVHPGRGFDQIRLEHPLEKGDHRVYVVLTQVDEDENGEQFMVNQMSHTMEFHVVDPE